MTGVFIDREDLDPETHLQRNGSVMAQQKMAMD